jgi:hypothetical protein
MSIRLKLVLAITISLLCLGGRAIRYKIPAVESWINPKAA